MKFKVLETNQDYNAMTDTDSFTMKLLCLDNEQDYYLYKWEDSKSGGNDYKNLTNGNEDINTDEALNIVSDLVENDLLRELEVGDTIDTSKFDYTDMSVDFLPIEGAVIRAE